MPLILAIEPERQQAALLSSLVRGRLRAELVLADTTEQALAAIGDRVPDLVLIPALLSAQEDAALAGALRMIAAAANVQMLTIPLLAAPAPVAERLGVLAKWRRSKPAAPAAAGCDPAAFAEQIASYLADSGEPTASDAVVEAEAPAPVVLERVESAAEVSAVEARGPSHWPRSSALIDWQGAPSASAPTVTPVISDLVSAEVAEVEELAVSGVVVADVAAVETPALRAVVVAAVEEPARAETGLVTESIDLPVVHVVAQPLEAVAVRAPSPALVVEAAEQLMMAPPSETLAVADEAVSELIQEPAIELFAAPPVAPRTEAVVEFDEAPIYEVSVDELAGDAALMASVEAMAATYGQSTVVDVHAVEAVAPREAIPTLDTGPDRVLFGDQETGPPATDVRVPPTPPAAVVAAVAPRAPVKPERPEWAELIESLRRDIARLKTERISPMSVAVPREQRPAALLAPDAGSPARVVGAVPTPTRPGVAAKKAPRPVQDEWGFFDPEQCGFASLLAKLSEVTEGNDGGGSSRQLNH